MKLLATTLLCCGAAGAAGAATLKSPMLNLHNNARVSAGTDKVRWSKGLAQDAARYAAECLPYADTELPETLGENMYWSSPFGSAEEAFGRWEAEKLNIREDGTCASACAHYLQVTDPTIKTIGCGASVCWGSYTLHVCRYSRTDSCKRSCRFEITKSGRKECVRRCRNNLSNRVISVLPDLTYVEPKADTNHNDA